jgi:hypothetical protein
VLKSAVISPCGAYRYRLWREWDDEKSTVLWIMLNPSTADGTFDDPTIKRCIAFSQREGFGSMFVGNLYAFRSTDPRIMLRKGAQEARGPDNAIHLWDMATLAVRVICAWGTPGGTSMPPLPFVETCCLGRTKHGAPRHPLYLPADTPLEPFP